MTKPVNNRILPELTSRQERILRFVVDQFTTSFSPVGSRTLSKLSDEHLSAATIRNTMADLEDMGYLTQPHTSAGRVPTDLGYRYYVDILMDQPLMPLAEKEEIDRFFTSYTGVVGSVLEHVSRILSRYSHYIGITSTPDFDSVVFRHLQFINQGSGVVLVIFISRSGLVFNKIIQLDRRFTQEELDKASRWVNDTFDGLNLKQVRDKIEELVAEERARYDELADIALTVSKESFKDKFGDNQVYIDGATNLLREQSFANSSKLDELLEAIDKKTTILDLIESVMEGSDVHVVIGSESELLKVQNCSLVAGSYTFPDGSTGNLAILGPVSMPYPRTIYLVDYVSKQISRISQS